jgi:hypothetical protein
MRFAGLRRKRQPRQLFHPPSPRREPGRSGTRCPPAPTQWTGCAARSGDLFGSLKRPGGGSAPYGGRSQAEHVHQPLTGLPVVKVQRLVTLLVTPAAVSARLSATTLDCRVA